MKSDPPFKPEPKSADSINVGSFAGAGLQFAITLVLFLLLGQWLDRKFGTAPVFLLIGVFVGGAGAFYSMYLKLSAAQKADDERRKQKREGRQ
jgi:F0F1-type ATP synthase assembly protein I